MEEPQVVILPRRRGRPKQAATLSSVSTRVPTQVHDQLVAIADYRGQSVSAVLRAFVTIHVRNFRTK